MITDAGYAQLYAKSIQGVKGHIYIAPRLQRRGKGYIAVPVKERQSKKKPRDVLGADVSGKLKHAGSQPGLYGHGQRFGGKFAAVILHLFNKR